MLTGLVEHYCMCEKKNKTASSDVIQWLRWSVGARFWKAVCLLSIAGVGLIMDSLKQMIEIDTAEPDMSPFSLHTFFSISWFGAYITHNATLLLWVIKTECN